MNPRPILISLLLASTPALASGGSSADLMAGVPLSPLLPAQGWSWVLWGGLAVALAGIVGVQVLERKRLSLVISVGGALAVTGAAVALYRAAAARELAVTTEEAALQVSPAPSAPERATLPSGTLVRVGALRGDFAEVSSPAGSGWLDRSALVAVVPDDR